MRRSVIILISVLVPTILSSQGVDRLIDSVMANNPEIEALSRLTVASEASARSGLYPENPEINFGYYPGKPSDIGKKTVWSVTQSFDFPTTYARIRDLKQSDLELARLEEKRVVLEILGEARKSAIEYIALGKKLVVMNIRIGEIDRLEEAYSNLLNLGEVTSLEYSKVRMQAVTSRADLNELLRDQALVRSRLDYLSGGWSSLLDESDYPILPEPIIDTLLAEKMKYHPAFLIPDHKIGRAEIEESLSKTASLPGFNIGYASETVASETFIGPQLGLTVPLWGNSGSVKAAKASRIYEESAASAEIESLKSSTIALFNNFVSIKEDLDMVNISIFDSDARLLLDRALESGQITITEYFIELREYYNIVDIQLDLQEKYWLSLSELWDYKFLSDTFTE